MNKAGRPTVPKDKALAYGLSVRLSMNEYKSVDAAAKRSGLSQSKWCRKTLTSAANAVNSEQ
jgi:hypothetical protein